MKGNEGIVPVVVVIWIAIGSLIAGAGISYLVFTVKMRVTPETDLRVAPGLVEAGQKVGYGFM